MNLKDKKIEAYKLGWDAHKSGAKRVPILDKNVWPLIEYMPVGTGVNQILKCWLSGWDYRNLSANVELASKLEE